MLCKWNYLAIVLLYFDDNYINSIISEMRTDICLKDLPRFATAEISKAQMQTGLFFFLK